MFCVPGSIQGWATQGESKTSSVDPGSEDLMCKRVGEKIFLCSPRDGKVLLRPSASC